MGDYLRWSLLAAVVADTLLVDSLQVVDLRLRLGVSEVTSGENFTHGVLCNHTRPNFALQHSAEKHNLNAIVIPRIDEPIKQ